MNATAKTTDPERTPAIPVLIRTSEAARILGLHEKTVAKWARHGIVPGFFVGNGWRFDRDELLEALRARTS